MDVSNVSKRDLLYRLIIAEALARPGEGPLARRQLARREPPAPVDPQPSDKREPG